MSVPSLKKLVLPATVLAGTMFSSLTVPLAVFGSSPVDVQLNQEPIFSGKFKDFAAPYVGVVGILSLGTGVAGVAIAGWQQSSRKSGSLEAKLSDLQQELKGKERQLEAVMLSDNRLQALGLDFFLQDETQAGQSTPVAQAELEPVVGQSNQPVVESRVSSAPAAPAGAPDAGPATVQSVVSTLAAAQAFLSFTRPNVAVNGATDGQSNAKEPSMKANITLQELQDQLKQIMSQVETLRSSLESESKPAVAQAYEPDYTVNTSDPLHYRPVARPQWIAQPLAS